MISRHICIIILYTVYLLFLEKTWLLNVFTHRLDLLRTKNWPQMRCSCLLPSQTTSITICLKVMVDSLMMPALASSAEPELIANHAVIVKYFISHCETTFFPKGMWACLIEEMAVSNQLTREYVLQLRPAQITKQCLSFHSAVFEQDWEVFFQSFNGTLPHTASLFRLPKAVNGFIGRAFSSFNKSRLCVYLCEIHTETYVYVTYNICPVCNSTKEYFQKLTLKVTLKHMKVW